MEQSKRLFLGELCEQLRTLTNESALCLQAHERQGRLEDAYVRFLLSYDLLPQEEKTRLEAQVDADARSVVPPNHPVMECTTKVRMFLQSQPPMYIVGLDFHAPYHLNLVDCSGQAGLTLFQLETFPRSAA